MKKIMSKIIIVILFLASGLFSKNNRKIISKFAELNTISVKIILSKILV
jgi:hypothetical protein